MKLFLDIDLTCFAEIIWLFSFVETFRILKSIMHSADIYRDDMHDTLFLNPVSYMLVVLWSLICTNGSDEARVYDKIKQILNKCEACCLSFKLHQEWANKCQTNYTYILLP